MRRITLLLAGISVPSSAIAQSECFRAGLGPYGAPVPAWALVMERPIVKSTRLQTTALLLKKGAELALQEYAILPQRRYLGAPITLIDDKGKSLTNAVPLERGATITKWRGAEGERLCSIGWKNGLFGGATGEGHYRWICFEDADRDGRLDSAWRPQTSNMGLGYRKIEMPLNPQVPLLDVPPVDRTKEKSNGPLESYPAYRRIEISGLKGKSVRLRYTGAGIAKQEVEIALDAPKSIRMAGLDLALAKNGSGMWTIAVNGAFEDQQITPTCNNSSWSIGTFDSRVMFSFPNW